MNYRQNTNKTVLYTRTEGQWSSSKVTAWSLGLLFVAILAYTLFSLFGGPIRPVWFKVSTYLLLSAAAAGSALLCWRNSRSPELPSGRFVWRLLWWGAASGTIAQVLTLLWEQVWGLRPDISPADPFYVGFYLFHLWALGLLIGRQRLTLNWRQGSIVLGVAALVLWLAVKLLDGAATVVTTPQPNAHPWGIAFVQTFQHLAEGFSLFYIGADVVLVIMAAILSLSFWGGRLAGAWQVMAQALVCICLADVWFAYLAKTASYRSGDLMELFWLAGLLQLAIAAALEWENGQRLRRLMQH
jgi:hypothetical protein